MESDNITLYGKREDIKHKRQNDVIASIIDFTAGSISGLISIAIGQPFDTIKVRLQTQPDKFPSAMHAVKSTLKNEGVKALFKGMASPLFTASIINAIVFGVYGTSIRYLTHHKEEDPALHQIFAAGCFAGFVQTAVLCPTDLVKCRLQIQGNKENNNIKNNLKKNKNINILKKEFHTTNIKNNINKTHTYYKGPIDCLKQILRTHGIRGLYHGVWASLYREVPSFGTYFAAYDYSKNILSDKYNAPIWLSSITAGAISGAATWIIVYPIDLVKSIIQTSSLDASRKEKSTWYLLKKLYKKHGYKYLFRGMGTTILRALPVNGVVFPTYELVVHFLVKFRHS